jgi:4-amino-4-deoxy-L-arabinose transferase-like glycosyltransferase
MRMPSQEQYKSEVLKEWRARRDAARNSECYNPASAMPNRFPSIAEPKTASLRDTIAALFASVRFQLPLITLTAAVLYLSKLGTGALLDWDEATYAQISREMAASGNWLSPTWAHQPFFKKPPLLFWLQAGLFHWFGASEFWARFPSALAAIGVVLLTYLIARRIASRATGFYAAFVLMTMNQFDRAAREGMTDALLCFCIFLGVYAWLRLRREEPAWFYLLCAAIGVGVLIKGPAVLVAPLAMAADGLITRNSQKLIAWRHYLPGALLVLAIVAPWHIWMMVRFGSAFTHQYIGIELGRRVTTVFEGSGGGPAYYLRVILLGALPWSLVALIALGKWIWRKRWGNSLMWILAGIVLIGYSLLPTGHQWYILPIYPALAIEVSRLLAETGERRRGVHYASVAVLAAGMMIAFVKLALRQGDAFTNQVAQLATMAAGAPHSGPLLVVPDTGTNSQLDVPTAVFYSNRPAEFIAIPEDEAKLDELVETYGSMDAIIQSGAVSDLSRSYDIRLKAENRTADYAEISAR